MAKHSQIYNDVVSVLKTLGYETHDIAFALTELENKKLAVPSMETSDIVAEAIKLISYKKEEEIEQQYKNKSSRR